MTNGVSLLGNQDYSIFAGSVKKVQSNKIGSQVKTNYVDSPIEKEEVKQPVNPGVSFKSNASDEDLYNAFKGIHAMGAANLYAAPKAPNMFTRMFIG